MTPASFTITTGILNLDITLAPLNPPIVIPAQGGQFSFTVSVANLGPAQLPYVVWARLKDPDGTYTAPTLGPVTINTPVGVTISRTRNQNVPGSWAAGLYTYLGYINTLFAYPALDSSSFPWTKSVTANNSPPVWEAVCSGDLFPGEQSVTASIPSGLELGISPNPFNSSTDLRYQLPEARQVSLRIYDTAGRLVATLVEGWQDAGTHWARFDGSHLSAGVYLYRLDTGNNTITGKMLLLK
jgi:hypothetical protein